VARPGWRTCGRARELTLRRLAGATRGAALRAVVSQTIAGTGIGIVLAAAAAALTYAGLHPLLLRATGSAPVVVPWRPASAICAGCLAVALLAAAIPAILATRPRLAAIR
jgi:putative ABC transport system permease protein